MSIQPVNPALECYTVHVMRRNVWRREGHPHAPTVPYKFFTEKDAFDWTLRNLARGTKFVVRMEKFMYDPRREVWL